MSWLCGQCSQPDIQTTRVLISDKLAVIQNQLFDIGSELACPAGSTWEGIPKTTADQVAQIESWIDELNSHLPELKSFVLPGGTHLNAHLHIARTVCRRVERSVLSLKNTEDVSDSILMYLNRLSDLLFVMSRYAAVVEGTPEYLWAPGSSSPDIRQHHLE
jgi:cob(I)alamin adenosyltransferase